MLPESRDGCDEEKDDAQLNAPFSSLVQLQRAKKEEGRTFIRPSTHTFNKNF